MHEKPEYDRSPPSLGGGLLQPEELFAATYEELRVLAAQILGRQIGRTPTLQPTAIVHEAFVRLSAKSGLAFADRAHFLRVAVKAMRHLIIDYARERSAAKRGGDRVRVSLDGATIDGGDSPSYVDLITLDEALTELASLNSRQCTVAELRFLVGMTIEECALTLSVSPVTVKADWRMARAWLLARLHHEL